MAESPKAYKRENNRQDRRSMDHEMQVVKRNGTRETISFDKITKRIRSLAKDLQVDPLKISQKVIENLYDGVSTFELDELTAQQAASMCLEHPDHSMLAGKVASSNHQKNTSNSFFKTVKMLYEATDINDNHSPIVSKELFDVVKKHKKEIEDAIDYERDFLYDYFGFQTLKRSYLLKVKGEPVERVQHMIMRVSLGIHCVQGSVDLASALETYDLMSRKMFTHATPTLFNSGTPKPQLSSCFLLGVPDSISGISQTWANVSSISKLAGGVGIWLSEVRSKGSYITGTNGVSNGIVPLARVFNSIARYVDQCLSPTGARLFTKTGLKMVRDLLPNDEILSDKGAFVRVEQIFERKYVGNMLRIKTADGSLECTPEHQILMARKYKPTEIIDNKLEQSYRSAGDLIEGDFVSTPKPLFEADIESIGLEDCEFIGIVVQFGNIDNTGGVLRNLPLDAQQFSKEYLSSRGVQLKVAADYSSWKLDNLPTNLPIINSMFPSKEDTLRLASCFMHLPEAKLRRLVKWIEHDTNCNTIAYIRTRLRENCTFHSIQSIEKFHYDGPVYDLKTQTEEGFATEIGIVHSA